MADANDRHSSRGSTPSQKMRVDIEEKRGNLLRRRSGVPKAENDEIQDFRSKDTTPSSQRDTPRKMIKRSTSNSDATRPALQEEEDVVGADITVKIEPGQAPKLSRSKIKKLPLRSAPKFFAAPDASPEASRGFEKLNNCTYANKYLGLTDPALECDCQEEWGKSLGILTLVV